MDTVSLALQNVNASRMSGLEQNAHTGHPLVSDPLTIFKERLMDDDFPQKNKYRAQRRALMRKTKDKVRKLIKVFNWGPESVKMAEHLQHCTCQCCHNPRDGNSASHDKTLQERRANEADDSEL